MPETDPGYLYDGLGRDELPSNDDKLPSVQKESIDGLIAAFKFMLEDEIAFAQSTTKFSQRFQYFQIRANL